MATTLTGVQCLARVGWDYENVVAGLTNSTQASTFNFAPVQFTSGVAANQADRIFVSSGTIAPAGNFSIILTNFVDFFGNTLSMVRFKVLFVMNTSANVATNLAIGNAANPLVNWISLGTTTIQVRQNGLFYLHALDATGYPIVGGASDAFKILNQDGANTAAYNLCIMGCSA